MANAFRTKSNQWILDTVDANLVTDKTLRVQGIRWVGATTATHQLIVTDSDNNVLWESIASGANYVESDLMLNRTWHGGFKLPTIGSGKLYIMLQQ